MTILLLTLRWPVLIIVNDNMHLVHIVKERIIKENIIGALIKMKVYLQFLTLTDNIMASLLQCLFHPFGFFRLALPLCSSGSSAKAIDYTRSFWQFSHMLFIGFVGRHSIICFSSSSSLLAVKSVHHNLGRSLSN